MFNKKEYLSKGALTAEVTTSERLNSRTGDVDQKIEATFFGKKSEEIGWCRIIKRGIYGIRVSGDYGLADYFGLTAEA